MSRKKFWAYLKNENGQPIPSASITFKLDDTGSLATIYSTSVSAANDEIDQSTLTTDVSGFFEFYIGDVYEQGTNRVGYDPDQQFRLEWSSPDGRKSGYIDDMLMFYQVFPVDETDSVSTTKNKLASNELSWGWSTHRQQTWFHEIHQITQVDRSDSVDSTYSHLVSNKFMNDLKSELESLQASGGESITIESSAAVVRSTDIATVSWTDDTSASGLYYYDFNHSFNTRYPLIQLWCTDLKCMQIPAKVVFTDVNTTRIYVPANQIVGKHIIGISEANASIQQENPEIPLSLQTLNVSSSSLTPYIEFDATPSAALQTLNMTLNSTSVSAASAASLPIPTGLIVPFNDDPSSIPADWSLWLNSDSSAIIMGAPAAASPSVSGGSNTVSSSAGTIFTTTTAGDHSGIGSTYYQTLFDGGTQFYSSVTGSQSSGDHSHDLEQFDYEPEYTGICFIQSDTDQNTLPSNAVVLSESGITGLSNVLTNSGRLLKLHNSTSPFVSGGGTPLANLTTGGNHFHGIVSVETDGSPINYQYIYGATVGDHTPTDVSIYVSQNLKRKLMSAWTHGSQSFTPSSGMIAMWESWTPPTGWEVCDGTNGTPDLRDHFVELVITGSEDLTGVGNHTLTISASDTHDFDSHDHSNPAGSLQNATNRVLIDHTNASFVHTHTGLVTDFSWKPLYQTVVFIRKST